MSGRTTATIPTVVADDEAPALDELLYLLKEFPEIEVVGTATNGLEALKTICGSGSRCWSRTWCLSTCRCRGWTGCG